MLKNSFAWMVLALLLTSLPFALFAQPQDSLPTLPYSRAYGSSETYFGPWAEVGFSKQSELRLGLGVGHMASGCMGWMTNGAGVGASYLPTEDWWGLTGTVWTNPIILNAAMDFGAYRSFKEPILLLRPRLGFRFVFFAIDYGFTISSPEGRQALGRHSLRLQLNFLRW